MRTLLFSAIALALSAPSQAQTTIAGHTPGSFRVTETGAAEYRIPIRVPPGVAGMEPKLALVYNSQAGNGILGVGWNLEGLSAITRCPRTMAQDGARGGVNYDGNDRFCLDGQRLMVVSGAYGADGTEYRTERESFTKVVSYGTAGNGPAWFKAWTKAGQIVEYGNTADSRIEAHGKASVRVWAASKVSDTKNNSLTLSYIENAIDGDFRLDRIDYSLPPHPSVRFHYENRTDVTPYYQAGSLSLTKQRLTSVRTHSAQQLIVDHRIAYDYGGLAGRSRVREVRSCDHVGACMTPVAFDYPALAAASLSSQYGVQGWSPSGGFTNATTYPLYAGDWNGDGKLDWGRIAADGAYFFCSTPTGASSCGYMEGWGTSAGFTDGGQYPVYTGDWNGDGKTDWGRVGSGGAYFFCSGEGGFVPCGFIAGWGTSAGFTNANVYPLFTGDWNGDGRTDWGRVSSNGMHFFCSDGTAFNACGYIPGWGPSAGFLDNNRYPAFTGDWNGDGKTDWGRVAGDGVYFICSSDTGFVTCGYKAGWGRSAGFTDGNVYPVFTGDWNGDGKTDWGRVASDGIYFFLSTGGGWVSPGYGIASLSALPGWGRGAGFVNNSVYPLFTGDWNGDGRSDWARVAGDGIYFFCTSPTGAFSACGYIAGWGPGAGFTNGDVYPLLAGDWNGDGKTDFARVQSDQMTFFMGTQFVPDAATGISSELTGAYAIEYKPLTDTSVYTKDFGTPYPNSDLSAPLYVVTTAAVTGAGTSTNSTYEYGGLRANHAGRGLLGFRWMDSTQPATGVKLRSDFSQDWPYVGLPSVVKKMQSSGAVLSEVTNTFACKDPTTGSACTVAPGNRYFPFVSQSVETANDLSGAQLPTLTTTTQYDAFGNATSVVVSTGDGYIKTTTNTYTNDTANWFLGRLTRSTVQSTAP